MICSQNELVAALQKALQAAGAPTGIAEDVARAGSWIAAHGGDGIGAVLAGLKSPLPPICEPQREGGKAHFHDARIALAGPSALDLLQAEACLEVLFYSSDSPLLLAGLAACRRDEHGRGYMITDDTPQARPHTVSTLGDLQSSPDTRLRIVANDNSQATPDPAGTEIVVEQQAWDHLLTLASAMYVPSSEQSRTAGAGAGLLDND